jgi:hypothetical protein
VAHPIALFFDGAEHDALTEAVNGGNIAIGGAVSISSNAAYLHRSSSFGGSRTYLVPSTANAYVQFFLGSNSAKDCCWYWHCVTTGTGGDQFMYVFDGATQHLTLLWKLDGSLELRRGTSTGTLLVSAAPGTLPRSAGLGHWCRADITIADAAGTFTLYANGASILTYTGDTRNAGNAYYNSIRFHAALNTSGSIAVDDFCAFDSTVAAAGEYFDVSPDANSDIAVALTPSSGALNYAMIDERPLDAADYNSKTPAVAGDGDTYGQAGFAGLGFTPASVVAVKVSAVFQRDGVITGAKLRLKSGATTYTSATQAGSAAGTAALKQAIWTVDPNGGADWDETTFDAAGHGAEGA